MIIAVDFDGTLCRNAYPNIGEPKEDIISMIKLLKREGAQLILWSCRNGEQLQQAVEWCRSYGLEFDAVNQNLPEIQQAWGGDTRKVFADMYIDDRNLGGLAETSLYELILVHLGHM